MSMQYEASPTGAKFHRSDSKVRLILGPVGSGKSTACVIEIMRRCQHQPKCRDGIRRSRWAIVRNTNQQLKTTTLATWKQWFPPGYWGSWKESEKTYYLEFGDVKAEILFLPLDTPDDAQRLLSLELTGVFFNEAREIAPELITAAFSRLGRYPSKAMMPKDTPYWYGLIMDTNPPSRDSFLYEKFEVEKPDGWEIFKQPGGLEPNAENIENLPPTYYPDMMNGASEDWIDVHVHGKYGRSLIGRPVFEKTFKRSFHVAETPLQAIAAHGSTLLIGMDFGRTPAAVIGQRHYTGRLNVLDALYVENIGLENFINLHLKPLLNEKFPHNKYLIIGDPAGNAKSQLNEENAFDVLKKKCKLSAVPAPTNDVEPRIRAVESLLSQQVDGKAMLLYNTEDTSAGMKHLIAAMDGGYMYKRKQNGSYDTTPDKNRFSHCFTGDVIVSTPNGSKRIDTLVVGDIVSTPFGSRVVTATMSRLASDFVELEFENGVVWRSTTDHPVYTLAGVVLSDALQYTEVLLVEGENTCDQPSTQCLSSTGSGFTENQTAITKQTTKSMEVCTCTGTCGNTTTDQYLPDTTCTTLTGTKVTTPPKTLSVLAKVCTRVTTAVKSWLLNLRGGKTGLHGRKVLQPSGMGPRKDWHGTETTVEKLGKTVNTSRSPAATAENNLAGFVAQTSEDIAALRAKAWREKNQELTTRNVSVLYADVVSELISTAKLKHAPKIVGVKHYRTQKPEVVYDLTVAEVHSFFAGGVWVSNCADAMQYLALGANLEGGSTQSQRREVQTVPYAWM